MALSGPVPIRRDFNRKSFDCGISSLNEFIREYAQQNERKNTSRTYVAVDVKRVFGYYTLVAGAVAHKEAPSGVTKGIGWHPVPVIVLARLAVDLAYQGKGIGEALLKDALLRALNASELVGARALLVHAIDENAGAFYQKYGFVESLTDPLHLFLTIGQIRQSL